MTFTSRKRVSCKHSIRMRSINRLIKWNEQSKTSLKDLPLGVDRSDCNLRSDWVKCYEKSTFRSKNPDSDWCAKTRKLVLCHQALLSFLKFMEVGILFHFLEFVCSWTTKLSKTPWKVGQRFKQLLNFISVEFPRTTGTRVHRPS